MRVNLLKRRIDADEQRQIVGQLVNPGTSGGAGTASERED